MSRPPGVAPGVYRLGTEWANFYLVADGQEYSLIDAGYPDYLELLRTALAEERERARH